MPTPQSPCPSLEPVIEIQVEPPPRPATWQQELADAVRDPDVLIDRLGLPDSLRDGARRAAKLFLLFVTDSFMRRMRPADPRDPLLLQVLPLEAETKSPLEFTADPLGE